MQISPTSLAPVNELESAGGTITLVPNNVPPITETDYYITDVRMSNSDTGITLDWTTDPTSLVISGAYVEQFRHRIGYAEPQVDLLTAPATHVVKTWAEVPPPENTGDIWFLFEYTPPNIMTRNITYSIDVEWIEREEDLLGGPEIVTDKSQTFTITQTVNYDIDANVAKFKTYHPSKPDV